MSGEFKLTSVYQNKITSELYFQFDDDQPVKVGNVYDNGEVSLHFKDDGADNIQSQIIFHDMDKKFKLFLRSV